MNESLVEYIPGGAPFLHLGGPTGCVVVHGYTGAPQEVRWLGGHLAEQGLTVMGVRLTGHGTRKEDMAPATWRHWAGCALDAVTLLHQVCEQVFIAGMSMGGTIALYAGVHYPVDGVISMGAPIYLENPRLWLANWVWPFVRYAAKRRGPGESPLNKRVRALQKARGEPLTGHVSYGYDVLPSVRQLLRLIRVVDAGLPRLRVPLLLMHSREDRVVSPRSMPHIHERAGSKDKAMRWIESGDHVITEDIHMEEVFEAAWQFIRTRAKG